MSLSAPPSVVSVFDYKWRNWLNDLYIVVKSLVLTTPTWTDLSLQNSWVNFGSGFADAAYIKHNDGLVEIKGVIKNGTITAGTIIATLPVGFRPLEKRLFVINSTSLVGRVDIAANGDITIINGLAFYLSLDSIVFLSEQ